MGPRALKSSRRRGRGRPAVRALAVTTARRRQDETIRHNNPWSGILAELYPHGRQMVGR